MTTAQISLCAALIVALPLLPRSVNAREPDAHAAWNAFFNRTAESYEIYRDQEQKERLLLHREPVYKWKAASAGDDVHGSVYVWTYRGCAEAVVCFWRNGNTMHHEGQSLSTAVLNPARAGGSPWRPMAGVTRKIVPGASPAAEKPASRSAQMRRLAGAFTAHSEAGSGERRELRVLTAPLYRYESSDTDVIDGGLFALVCSVGTDPEAFLLIEARKTDAGPRWHYALVRFSHLNLYASYDGERVWAWERGMNQNADHTYYLVRSPQTSVPALPDDDGRPEER